MTTAPSFRSLLQRRVDAALGRIPCDLVIRSVRYLDVFSGEWRDGDVSVIDGTIVALEPGLKARRVIEGAGLSLVPGFIDAHVHVESSMLTPFAFEQAVLPQGTTTAICDPHELANVQGVRGIRYFLEAASRLSLDLRVMLSSCVPATDFETNGGGRITSGELLPLASHPKALGLAEMMNFPGVLHGDAEVHAKLDAFAEGRIDGHAPLVRGLELSAYAAAGISSCHESSELEEAREKLSKGMAVWIREGSVAKDLHALAPLITAESSAALGFCTDDRNPLDIASEGHLDHLVRESIRLGIPGAHAYRAASWSVARHYGLDRGRERVGAIAPGWRADMVLLENAAAVAIREVFRGGVPVSELPGSNPEPGSALAEAGRENSVRCVIPELADLEAPRGRVNVIGVIEGKILTDHRVMDSSDPGVLRFSVLERHGRGSKPANAYVHGFGEKFRGAIAASVGHDSHNLTGVSDNPRDLRTAWAALQESGGGVCVVRDGVVVERLALPMGGLMSPAGPHEVAGSLRRLREASREIGCVLPEPFLQLAFLSLPVIPALKLTDRGLFDVRSFRLIDVRAS